MSQPVGVVSGPFAPNSAATCPKPSRRRDRRRFGYRRRQGLRQPGAHQTRARRDPHGHQGQPQQLPTNADLDAGHDHPQGSHPTVPRPDPARVGNLRAHPAAGGAVHAPRRYRHLRPVEGRGTDSATPQPAVTRRPASGLPGRTVRRQDAGRGRRLRHARPTRWGWPTLPTGLLRYRRSSPRWCRCHRRGSQRG